MEFHNTRLKGSAPPRSVIEVASFSSAYSGNFIASLQSLSRESESRGLRTVWVFPESARSRPWFIQLADEAKTVYTLPENGGRIACALKLAAIARRENAAIIHTHFSRYDIAAWVAKAISALSLRRIEVIWHAHSDFAERRGWGRLAKDALKLRLMGRSAHLITVSEALCRDHIVRGFPKARAHVVPNGIDADRATHTSRPAALVRSELNIPEHTLMLLGFGWAPVVKGVDTVLEAIDALGRGGENAVLVLVGTEELRRFVAEWPAEGFRSSIRVLPPTESIADLYSAADIFISASRSEGWSYSVAEALANGVPVASTRIPGVSWAADAPGVTFFRPGDSRGLVQAIRYIASLPAADRSALAGRSRAFIRERHSVQEWARRIVRLFEETTGQGLPAGIALSARGQ